MRGGTLNNNNSSPSVSLSAKAGQLQATTQAAALERQIVTRAQAGLPKGSQEIDEHGLERQIVTRAQAGFSPLTHLTGINLLTAGALAGLRGPGRRFQSEAPLAAYAGVAPREASSAGRVRHRLNRLNRGGNRRLNAILYRIAYRIALTQLRCCVASRAAQDYVARRLHEGKTKREAIRALKRYLIRAIWRLWQEWVPSHLVPSHVQAAS